MDIVLESVLNPAQVTHIRNVLLGANFVDGSLTSTLAGKKNLQLPHDSTASADAGEVVLECLRAHEIFQLAVQPQFVLPPLFSRYEVGMEYPDHIDCAIMDGRRADVSITLFLEDPDDYEGGELVVDSGREQRSYRLNAGDAIAYPSSTVHHVARVTRGTRFAAVLWVQSLVRDPAKRRILFDVGSAAHGMSLVEGPYSERLRQSYLNLVRIWAEA